MERVRIGEVGARHVDRLAGGPAPEHVATAGEPGPHRDFEAIERVACVVTIGGRVDQVHQSLLGRVEVVDGERLTGHRVGHHERGIVRGVDQGVDGRLEVVRLAAEPRRGDSHARQRSRARRRGCTPGRTAACCPGRNAGRAPRRSSCCCSARSRCPGRCRRGWSAGPGPNTSTSPGRSHSRTSSACRSAGTADRSRRARSTVKLLLYLLMVPFSAVRPSPVTS